MLCLQPVDDDACAHVLQSLNDMLQESVDDIPAETTKVHTVSNISVVPSMLTHRHPIHHLVTLRAVDGHLQVHAVNSAVAVAPFVLKLSDLRVFDFRQNGIHRIGVQLNPLRGHGNKIVLTNPAVGDIAALRTSLVACVRECASGKMNVDYQFTRLAVERTYLSEYLRLPAVVDICIAHSTVHFLNSTSGVVVHTTSLETLELNRVGERQDGCTLFLKELPEFLLDCMEGSYLNLTPVFKLGGKHETTEVTFEDMATSGLAKTVPITIQEIGFNNTIARETVYSSVADAWESDVLAASGRALRRVTKPALSMRDVMLASHGNEAAAAKLRLHNILVQASSQMLSPVIARTIGRSRTLAECGLHLDSTTGQIQGCILTPGKFTFQVLGKQRVGCFTMTSKQQIVVHVSARNGVDRILYDGMVVDPASVDAVPMATLVVQAGRRSTVPRVEPALDSSGNEQWFNMKFLQSTEDLSLPGRRHDTHTLWKELEHGAGQTVDALKAFGNQGLNIYRDGSIVAQGAAGYRHVEVGCCGCCFRGWLLMLMFTILSCFCS